MKTSEVPHEYSVICKAKSKQSGMQCRNFTVKDKRVCYLHGGLSTGPRTAEGKLRQHMSNWKHGMRSKEAIAEARTSRALITQSKAFLVGL